MVCGNMLVWLNTLLREVNRMINYQVIEPLGVKLFNGILELTPNQANKRTSVLAELGSNLYSIKGETHFKLGEVFGYDGELPRSLAVSLAEIDVTQEPEKEPEGDGSGELKTEEPEPQKDDSNTDKPPEAFNEEMIETFLSSNVKDIEIQVKDSDDVALLEAILEYEATGQARKGVIESVSKRLEELKTSN